MHVVTMPAGSGTFLCPHCNAHLARWPSLVRSVTCPKCYTQITKELKGVSETRRYIGNIVFSVMFTISSDWLLDDYYTPLQIVEIYGASVLFALLLWWWLHRWQSYEYQYQVPSEKCESVVQDIKFKNYLQQVCAEPSDMIGHVRTLLFRFQDKLRKYPETHGLFESIQQSSEHLPSVRQQADWQTQYLAEDMRQVSQLMQAYHDLFVQHCQQLLKAEQAL